MEWVTWLRSQEMRVGRLAKRELSCQPTAPIGFPCPWGCGSISRPHTSSFPFPFLISILLESKQLLALAVLREVGGSAVLEICSIDAQVALSK